MKFTLEPQASLKYPSIAPHQEFIWIWFLGSFEKKQTVGFVGVQKVQNAVKQVIVTF